MSSGGDFTSVSELFELLKPLLLVLIPLVIMQLVLMITALVSMLKRDTYKMGNRVIWILVVVLVNTIGPILYFVLGRKDE